MNNSLKEQLLTVPSEKLIELIFELADDNDVSWNKIQRLVSKPKDNSRRFLRRLNEIKNRGGFVPWKHSSRFSDEMTDILADLDSGIDSPDEGFDLICAFYKADASFFEQADDSSGHLGDVFRGPAVDIFIKFASQVFDKKKVIHTMLELMKDDGYGIRDDLINHAGKFLSEPDLRELFRLLENTCSDGSSRHSSWKLQSVARQLKDAPLFEKTVRQANSEPNSKALAEIAEVYFLTDDLTKSPLQN